MLNLIPTSYKILGILLFILAIAGSSYYYGYSKAKTKAEHDFLEKENKAQAQIINLQNQLAEAKDKVIIKYINKVKVITERKYIYVDQAKNTPSKCELSSGWVYLHDSSAKGNLPDASRSSDATSSGIRDNKALETVVSNYSTCRQTSEQLKALQEWIRENKKIIEGNNK